MLKIKDNVDIDDILKMSNFEYEADSDYEGGWHYAQYCDGNIVLDVSDNETIKIKGIDESELDLLYDLIKADLVEKVKD
jgi:hypothetical protein